MSDEADSDLIAHYRASARGIPDAALDRSILGAARAASWRRRHAWIFAAAAAAACTAIALSLGSFERAAPPGLNAETVAARLEQARTRAFLLDVQAMHEAALAQQPGATARPNDSIH